MISGKPMKPLKRNRARNAVLQVALLVVLVPLGILLGWFVLAPSSRNLAEHAAGGADSAALLELVRRAAVHGESAAALQQLLSQDAGAVNALAMLATGHEEALLYLISHARTRQNALAPLADMEMSYAFALAMLRSIESDGMPNLVQKAESCANARFMLGVAYENGCHVVPSWAQAAEWYARALESGYTTAEPYYSRAAYRAGLAERNSADSAAWYRVAAERGHAAAQCALGVCYAEGEGVCASLEEAVKWYRLAAEQGYSDAQYNLGWCFMYGEGVPRDAEESVRWFRLAAGQGDDLAQYYVGRAYETGEGVPQDYAEALRWYHLAVEHGNAAAQCAMGHCYAYGKGVSQNWQKAVYWYRLSAEQGRSEAQLALAACYEAGHGVAKDAASACHWRRCAASESQSTSDK